MRFALWSRHLRSIFSSPASLAQNSLMYLGQVIEDVDSILDVGSGSGRVAQLIQQNMGIKVICMDVQDHHKAGIKPVLFDGVHIPFNEGAFSAALGCFILHHAPLQTALLNEMKRVIRSKMFIMEDTPDAIWDKLLLLLHRLTARINYSSKKMRFRSSKEWRALFGELGLHVEKEIRIKRSRELFYPVSRRLFVLAKVLPGQ